MNALLITFTHLHYASMIAGIKIETYENTSKSKYMKQLNVKFMNCEVQVVENLQGPNEIEINYFKMSMDWNIFVRFWAIFPT